MSTAITSIRLDTKLADEAVRALGVKSRTEAVHIALQEMVGNRRFKDVIRKSEGKLKFAGFDE
jgi:Arc/MetJ family transcription regulator